MQFPHPPVWSLYISYTGLNECPSLEIEQQEDACK